MEDVNINSRRNLSFLGLFLQQPEQQQVEGHSRGCVRWSRWRSGAAANGKQANWAAGTHVQRPHWPENTVSSLQRGGCVKMNMKL